jgi:glycosyltransferase involved in cell wall biosynthesis
MRVLALCSYPVEAAATRFRVQQFVEPLGRRGVDLTLSPFLGSDDFKKLYSSGGLASKAAGIAGRVAKRVADVASARKFDLILVQREAMIFGPAVFEWLYSKIGGVPIVLDLDDATYVRYVSPTYGRLGSFFKFFGKTDNLIRRSALVTCGNRFIAEYVGSRGGKAAVIPTVVDLNEFRPREECVPDDTVPTVGWIGTHSTFPFLETILPVLARLAKRHSFRLKIVGAGLVDARIKGVEVENLEWKLEREVSDFQSFDLGLYPISTSSSANRDWIRGKSGFKAIQYMAVGVPFVMSPVGVCAEIGEAGKTHFSAETSEDWYNSLKMLLSDAALRRVMGSAGRRCAEANFDLENQADLLAATLRKAVGRQAN